LIHFAIFIVLCRGLKRPTDTKFANFITVLRGATCVRVNMLTKVTFV
jgi:hypothetical protein